ncbi:hypothetical protein MF265_21470 [Serratia marcescens]|uniref:hypothetical protein n=1 Tax=Serratia marcescens TaxID=615 RepID=UPI001EEFA33F|nr:hypothetical protein [Serratia marcescens]ULH10473.1 hypothetical protein MF265_21470 [Serratia marcescens]
MNATKETPGIWGTRFSGTGIVGMGEVFIVTAADVETNETLEQGTLFTAQTVFSLKNQPTGMTPGEIYFPSGEASNSLWHFSGNDNQLYTKDKPGVWNVGVPVGRGCVFQVTPNDVSRNSRLVLGSCFVAKKDFVINNSDFPSGEQDNDDWKYDGKEPLRTKGRPGIWNSAVDVFQGDIFMVNDDDAKHNAHLRVGDYYRACDDYIPLGNNHPYPDSQSSNDSWEYAGNNKPYTKENPGTWVNGRHVSSGDIVIVTERDAARNPSYTQGNYFCARKAFTMLGVIAFYPPSDDTSAKWKYVGNDQPYTTANPGVWMEHESATSGEVFMVNVDDLIASSGNITEGNYFRVLQTFTMGTIPDYPAGNGSNDHWQFTGRQAPYTYDDSGIWINGAEVKEGDIFIVTSRDASQGNHPTEGRYFRALQAFTMGATPDYPAGSGSNSHWQSTDYTRETPGVWAVGVSVRADDIFKVTATDTATQPTKPTADYYFKAKTGFTIADTKTYYYPTGYSDNSSWQCVTRDRQHPGMWQTGTEVAKGDIFQVTASDTTAQSTKPTAGYFFQAKNGFTIAASDKYPAGYSDNTDWTCVTRDRQHPGRWEIGTEVAIGDIFQVTSADTSQLTHPTEDFYFQADKNFTIINAVTDQSGDSDNGKPYFFPPGYNDGKYWKCIARGRQQPGIMVGSGTQIVVGKGDIFRVTADNAIHQPTLPTEGAYFRARQGFIITGDTYEYHFPTGYGKSDQWVCVTRDRGHPGVWGLYAEVAEQDVFQVTASDVKNNPSCTVENYFQAAKNFNINEVTGPSGGSDNGKPYFFPDGDTSNAYWIFSERNKDNPGVWGTGGWVSEGDIFMVTSTDVTRNKKNNPNCVLDCFFQAKQDFEITAAAAHDFPAGFDSNEYWQCVTSGTFEQPASWNSRQHKPVYQYDVFQVTVTDAATQSLPHLVDGMYFIAQRDDLSGCANHKYPDTGDLRQDTKPPKKNPAWDFWQYPEYIGIEPDKMSSGGNSNGTAILYLNGRHQVQVDMSVTTVKVRWPGYATTGSYVGKEVSISSDYLAASTAFTAYKNGKRDGLLTASTENDYCHPAPSAAILAITTHFPLYLSATQDVGAVGCRITLGAFRQYCCSIQRPDDADADSNGSNLAVNYKAPVDYSATNNGALTNLSISSIHWDPVKFPDGDNHIFWTVWLSDNGPRYQYTSGSLETAQVTIKSSSGLRLHKVTAVPVGNGWTSGPAGLSSAADAVLSWNLVDSGSAQPYYGGNAIAWYVQPEKGANIGFTRLRGRDDKQDGLKAGTTFSSTADRFTYQVYLGSDSPTQNPAGLTPSTGTVTVSDADVDTQAINLIGVRVSLPLEASLGQDGNTSYVPRGWDDGCQPRRVTVTDECGNESTLQISFDRYRPVILVDKASS